MVASLLPNATVQQAQLALNVVYARLEQEYPDSNTGRIDDRVVYVECDYPTVSV